jgi:immune inhibitor A
MPRPSTGGSAVTLSVRRLATTLSALMATAAVIGAAWLLAAARAPLPPDTAAPPPLAAVGSAAEEETSTAQRMGATLDPLVEEAKQADFHSDQPPSGALIDAIARFEAGPGATAPQIEAAARAYLEEWRQTTYHGPEPARHEALLAREQAMLAGRDLSPDASDRTATKPSDATTDSTSDTQSGAAVPAQAAPDAIRVLAVAVEFAGRDEVVDFSHPISVVDPTCITETITYEGPLHNEIPPPAGRDNYTWWHPNFDAEYYEKLIFSKEGVTERLRMDLTDPADGLPGIDIAGRTMATYFEEVAGGRVTFDGGSQGVQAWVQVPHSMAYYAANACINGVAGGRSTRRGLPSNPRWPNGTATLLEDIAASINASDPDFPWAEYDTDGDNVIDHFQMIYAGMSRSVGGGSYGYQTIWAHRGTADGNRGGIPVDDSGTPDDPSDDIRLLRYTAQAENTSLGTLVHEFGHDFGLADFYDTSYDGTSNVAWWDLMAYGGSTGAIRGSQPAHMSAYNKLLMGWTDPLLITPTEDAALIELGQTSNPPAGSEQALRIEMPPSELRFTTPPAGSAQMWWSGNDANWFDARLWRNLDLRGVPTDTQAISLTFDLDYVTEADADFLFLEVRPGGSNRYIQTPGYRVGSDELLTTPEDYADPKGRLARFGNPQHGYTGDSGGWIQVWHDLSPYAGQQIRIRPRYATDGSLRERGAFLDNIRVLADDEMVWQDPVESDSTNGWRRSNTTFTHLYGGGWQLSDGTLEYPWYYLLEWRNLDGFDAGLASTYHEVFRNLTDEGATEIHADWIPTNAPGLLVWLRDTRFGNNGLVRDPSFRVQPSEGPKGRLLLVDAHPEPLRGQRHGRLSMTLNATDTRTIPYPPNDNWHGNVQATNAAFNLHDTPAVTLTYATDVADLGTYRITRTAHTPWPGTTGFHDALGYFPGIEALPVPVEIANEDGSVSTHRYAFSDPDASVVVPAAGYYPPRTPLGFTGVTGEEQPGETVFLRSDTLTIGHSGAVAGDDALAVVDVGEIQGPQVSGAQSGNPGDHDVHFGYHFVVEQQNEDASVGTIRIWRDALAAELDVTMDAAPSADPAAPESSSNIVRVATDLRNVGGAYTLTLIADFDPAQSRYVGLWTEMGGWPVAASVEEILAAVADGGREALAALAVAPELATRVAQVNHLSAGRGFTMGFSLVPLQPGRTILVDATVYGSDAATPLARATANLSLGTRLYLPAAMRDAALR